jgi:molybdopterin synthase sulfur carrier subunit
MILEFELSMFQIFSVFMQTSNVYPNNTTCISLTCLLKKQQTYTIYPISSTIIMKMSISSIKVKVLYFANAKEIAGTREEEFTLSNPASSDLLLRRILEIHPGIKDLRKTISISVNRKIICEDILLNDKDEVALLPPVAGG